MEEIVLIFFFCVMMWIAVFFSGANPSAPRNLWRKVTALSFVFLSAALLTFFNLMTINPTIEYPASTTDWVWNGVVTLCFFGSSLSCGYFFGKKAI